MSALRGLLGLATSATDINDPTTGWYPMSINPVRVGWYELRFWIFQRGEFSGPCRRYWDGRRWSYETHGQRAIVITIDDEWRGRANP